jgi:hypothetical protein
MKTAIFTEPMDTVRTSPDEVLTAEALLKLLMATPQGALLSTTHAIDSSVLLHPDVGGNADFIAMVQDGRLRFGRWPDGQGPTQALETALSSPEYVLSGWPELEQEPSLRPLALEVWLRRSNTTGVPSLDSRIDIARELFAAEENQPLHLTEGRRGPLFAEALERAAADLPKPETPRAIVQAVLDLSTFEGRHARGKVYRWVDKRDMSPQDKARLKDFVDLRYNRTVADSLGLPFHSARRIWKTLPSRYHQDPALSAALDLFQNLADSKPLAYVNWATMRLALAPYSQREYSKQASVAAFNQLLGSVATHKRALAIGGAIVGTAASVSVTILLQDAASEWARLVLSGLAQVVGLGTGVLAGRETGAVIDKYRAGKHLQSYVGWLDAMESAPPT